MTVTINSLSEEELRRLSWRCRRGLLELDIILQRFSTHYLAHLNTDELKAFDRLLDLPDNELFDVVTHRVNCLNYPNALIMQQVIKKLSNTFNKSKS